MVAWMLRIMFVQSSRNVSETYARHLDAILAAPGTRAGDGLGAPDDHALRAGPLRGTTWGCGYIAWRF